MAKNDPNAPENAPDMNRYWYPPGKTEPELRAEFSNKTPAPAPPEVDDSSDAAEAKKGKLPEDFPHYAQLEAAGITSYGKLRELKGDYSSIDGIGEARAKDIDAALAE